MNYIELGGARIKLICHDCGKEKITWISQVAKSSLVLYRCKKCQDIHRKCSGFSWNKNKANKVNISCSNCGKQKELNASQLETGSYKNFNKEKYLCRACYIEKKKSSPSKIKLVQIICKDCGKIRFYKKSKANKAGPYCMKCKNKGERNHSYIKNASRIIVCSNCGHEKKVRPNEYLKYKNRDKKYLCIKCFILEGKKGENNPAWKGGLSFLPYPPSWTKQLKKDIWDKCNSICQICGIKKHDTKLRFHVHHIDYDKNNTSKDNLILLCQSCHSKTNYNRDEWIKFFNFKRIEHGDRIKS